MVPEKNKHVFQSSEWLKVNFSEEKRNPAKVNFSEEKKILPKIVGKKKQAKHDFLLEKYRVKKKIEWVAQTIPGRNEKQFFFSNFSEKNTFP